MESNHAKTGSDAAQDIAVFGLGYVGTVTAACLANLGHRVIGVDVAASKVDALNAGRSPVLEPGLAEVIQYGTRAGRLRATTDVVAAVASSSMAFICVGTPSLPNGSYDMQFVRRVSEDIGTALKSSSDYYGVVMRSTVVPGTGETIVTPAVEAASSRSYPEGFGVASNPEFLREGSAVADFGEPPFTIVGTPDERLGAMLRQTYASLAVPFLLTDLRVAESVKMVSNAFHAIKVVFANEVGTLCREFGADARAVMNLFVQDRKLNISEKYLRPGFAFGGSCLPKDLRALTQLARQADLELPLLTSVLRSNELHIQRGIRMVERTGAKNVAVLGLTFKPETDDLRESPVVELAQVLLGRGCHLKIYDPSLKLAQLMGTNKAYIEGVIPHLSRLLVSSADEALAETEVAVVSYHADEFQAALERTNGSLHVVDLAGIDPGDSLAGYEAIAW